MAFIKKHPGKVGLVTVSIGGNDIDGCISTVGALGCVAKRMPAATANLTKIAKRLRAAGSKQMRIIGSTYPDVVLGAWVLPIFGGPRFTLVSESLTAFAKLINPVEDVCKLTYFCDYVNIHMTTSGYGIIAKLEAATLPPVVTRRS